MWENQRRPIIAGTLMACSVSPRLFIECAVRFSHLVGWKGMEHLRLRARNFFLRPADFLSVIIMLNVLIRETTENRGNVRLAIDRPLYIYGGGAERMQR